MIVESWVYNATQAFTEQILEAVFWNIVFTFNI